MLYEINSEAGCIFFMDLLSGCLNSSGAIILFYI
jgi:hypothetical protein